VKASHLIAPGEHVTVEYDIPYSPTLFGENIALDVVFEDDYLIVVNKPAGLIVHPGAGNATGTLVNALIYHCEHLSNDNGLLRPGIVHRLDKDTSGLLISAKDNSVHGNLRSQFSKRSIEKYYDALVWGRFDEDRGDIDAPIGRSPKNRKKFTVIDTGRPSLTRYEVLERFEFLTLVRVKLETGRTHQIRVHMTHVNHPLFGDPYYGGRNSKIITLNMRQRQLAAKLLDMLNRQALHARRLVFTHPKTGETLDLQAPLHDDFEDVLALLREGATQ
jgi:23S rRNA pseudouridine1911/1915/1917 synthase